MMNAAIPLEYLFAGVAILVLFFWNPRVSLALLKSAFFFALYAVAIPALYRWPDVEATWEAHFLGSLAIPLGVVVFSGVLFAIAAYFIDRDFDQDPQDHFKGKGLFFRYGAKVFESILPIQLDGEEREGADSVAARFREFIWEAASKQFGGLREVALTQQHVIKDLGWKKEDSYHYRHGEKEFFKASFQTARNSTLYYFVHMHPVGRHLLVHQFAYKRGRHFWYHALLFFATAPFHVWFWGYAWVKGRYSIMGRLNRHYDESSYDRMDLNSYYWLAGHSMMMAARQFADANGLLNEELERLILNDVGRLQGRGPKTNLSSRLLFLQGSRNLH